VTEAALLAPHTEVFLVKRSTLLCLVLLVGGSLITALSKQFLYAVSVFASRPEDAMALAHVPVAELLLVLLWPTCRNGGFIKVLCGDEVGLKTAKLEG
jgi:hypothetical protein